MATEQLTTPRGAFKDLTGRVFTRLTVLRRTATPVGDKGSFWVCLCSCGKEKVIRAQSLVAGGTKSCGCFSRESVSKREFRHGLSHTKEHQAWASALSRCNDPGNKDWRTYGGCGIKVSERWQGRDGFVTFLADMGLAPSPEHSLDRFPDRHGNYEPGNCRWATRNEQQRNRRDSVMLTFRGETKSAADWADIAKVPKKCILSRIKKGWSVEESLTTPVKER